MELRVKTKVLYRGEEDCLVAVLEGTHSCSVDELLAVEELPSQVLGQGLKGATSTPLLMYCVE